MGVTFPTLKGSGSSTLPTSNLGGTDLSMFRDSAATAPLFHEHEEGSLLAVRTTSLTV